jgi:NTE family protein
MNYDLVFEGGGAKGMAFVGACEELFKRGHGHARLLGTSAGAITATLLAAGYTPEEMLAALNEKGPDGKSVFTSFMGEPSRFSAAELEASGTRKLLESIDFTFLPNVVERKFNEKLLEVLERSARFRHVLGLVERGGWFAADRFVEWMQARLDSGHHRGAPRRFSGLTLSQFHAASGVELSLVASDTTDGAMLVLNHHTAPDCPVVWAVRMSMSIPLLWDEVIWRPEWGSYRGRPLTGHAIVDGGVLSNFPIELFISDERPVLNVMGPKSGNDVLGLLIDETRPVEASKGLLVRVNIKPGELRTVQRLQRLVDTATGAHDKMVIDEYQHLVVRLPAQGYGTTEFDMSDERRNALVEAGRVAMAQHLDAPDDLLFPTKGPGARHGSVADRIATRILAPMVSP